PGGLSLAITGVMGVWASVKNQEPSSALNDGVAVSVLVGCLVSLVLWLLFAPALARIALAAARGQRPRIADLFDFRRAGSLFVAALLSGLAIMGGFLLLIIPGFIALIGLGFVSFFVVDGPEDRGALDALRASWNATRGHRLHLFGFGVLYVLACWL